MKFEFTICLCLPYSPCNFSIIPFAALIESDAEGIGGSGFVECIREHIHSVIWILGSCNWWIYTMPLSNLLISCFIIFVGLAMPFDRWAIYCCKRAGESDFYFFIYVQVSLSIGGIYSSYWSVISWLVGCSVIVMVGT